MSRGLRIGVGLLVLTMVGSARASARPIELNASGDGGSIVYDGLGDIGTFNDSGGTDLFGSLGGIDLSLLRVRVSNLDPLATGVSFVKLLLSIVPGSHVPSTPADTCLNVAGLSNSDCQSISQVFGFTAGGAGSVYERKNSGPAIYHLDDPIIPFVASLEGPLTNLTEGALFSLNASDQSRLSTVLSKLSPGTVNVGLSVGSFTGGLGGSVHEADFTVTFVPEPAAWLLFGSGLTLLVINRRRTTRQAS